MKFEKYLYWILIFLLPTQLAFHYWPDYSFVFGIKVDYLSPTIFLTDVLLFLLAAISFPKIKKRLSVNAVVLGVVLVVLNLLIAKEPLIALIKWVKILEMAFLFIYASINKHFNKMALISLFYSIIFFSLIGISQFILQRTIGGPFYLLGERSFSVNTPGIALANLLGRDYLRAYSTFPHPNALAGFLGAGGILILLLNSQLKIFSKRKLWLFVLISSAAFLLTFSSGALIAGMLALIYYFLLRKNNFVVTKNSFFPAKKIFYIIVGLSLLMTVLPEFIKNIPLKSESITLRIDQAGIAGKMFVNNPLLGVGLNNFIPSAGRNITAGTSLFLQPVHNIYLLLLAEAGLVGFAFFIYLAGKFLSAKTKSAYMLPIFFVILTGFFDHYWFTLQQNQLLLAFLLGISWKN